MQQFKDNQVSTILALCLEADLDADTLTGEKAKAFTTKTAQELKESIELASHISDNFIAFKLTSLLSPKVLLKWSLVLADLKLSFNSVANGKEITYDQFAAIHELEAIPADVKKRLFESADANKDGIVSFLDINAVITLRDTAVCKYLVEGTNPENLTLDDLDVVSHFNNEIDSMCAYAQEKAVRVIIDAEQTYFQPAINDLIIGLCRTFNVRNLSGPLIFNTYQMYLKNSVDLVISDVKRAEEAGYSIGLKVVRGAYMVSERQRALEMGYPSPIHDTIEDSHDSFNAAIKFLIEQIASNQHLLTSIRQMSLIVASHNRESNERTCEMMKKYGIAKGTLILTQTWRVGWVWSVDGDARCYYPFYLFQWLFCVQGILFLT
jgi:proline dehydrogenase